MKVKNKNYKTVWLDKNNTIKIIDQRWLPDKFIIESLHTVDDVCVAIKDMRIRGAGAIGALAGYGMYLATQEGFKKSNQLKYIKKCAKKLKETRPTAVNLSWAVDKQLNVINLYIFDTSRIDAAFRMANKIAKEDEECCKKIGEHGLKIIEKISKKKKGETVNILTHCNAGWLAFVDYGTALSPIYLAHQKGIKVHVWVDETRPRNQGARLTAWELEQAGIPYTVIVDNVGGHLMQHKMVDIVIVGSDRTTSKGDVANKIGTYLKALAAKDNNIPFYVALPSSTIDWKMKNGIKEIPIEQRNEEEVKFFNNKLITCKNASVANYAFDVTPARLVTALITEKGICKPNKINELYKKLEKLI